MDGARAQKLESLKNSEISACINEYVRNERNREILKQRLLNGATYERLAERFDLSVSQIKRIVYREQERIFEKLK
jgi:DNA-directed RNA polymerase specialized sigma24 family protein